MIYNKTTGETEGSGVSILDVSEPQCRDRAGRVEMTIEARSKDLGGFSVRRVLPAAKRQMVGPFIFFDHMGPAEFPPGKGIDVRPHPHIGLATVTYLFEGEILHRDSLGYVQPIRAGAVNLMTAGSGIVHSERSGNDRKSVSKLHGIQSWMALPTGHEECVPAFVHYPASYLPKLEINGVEIRLIIGEAFGQCSPVVVHSSMLYVDVRMPSGASLMVPDAVQERAVYVVSGDVSVGDQRIRGGTMAVVSTGVHVDVVASEQSHVMIIGGAPLGRRHIWWNFVSTTPERIEVAKADWRAGRFDPVPEETEFIPLPE